MSRDVRIFPTAPAITWQGWVVAGVAAAGMVLAAVAFAVAGLLFGIAWGLAAFAVVAIAAGGVLLVVARRVSDRGASATMDGPNARHP